MSFDGQAEPQFVFWGNNSPKQLDYESLLSGIMVWPISNHQQWSLEASPDNFDMKPRDALDQTL